jgi:putative transposase
MKDLTPKDRAESVALFRAQVVGALAHRDLDHGQLCRELERLSRQRFRPPDSLVTKTYGVSTLERWFYGYRSGGLEALKPRSRSDRGRARHLTDTQKELLVAIRREHPGASVPLILRTLVNQGTLKAATISAATLRRFYRERGLDRVSLRGSAGKQRLRWQASHPDALWHGDVCHGPSLRVGKSTKPLRIHALLDDASRYIVAIEAHYTEREQDMLQLFADSIRRRGTPDGMYLDNGSTYRGVALRTACERLGVTLIHAQPYDPQARGKMERFWRTCREGCLDFIDGHLSLHDVNVRLCAFVDSHYHRAPHAGLMGQTPLSAYEGVSGFP